MKRTASFQRVARAKMSEQNTAGENLVTLVTQLGDGSYIVEKADGKLERLKEQTDWSRFDAMTDEDVERAIADDPDWAEFRDIDWSKIEVRPNDIKVPISIRLDPDVLAFFKEGGAGYQKRINAVLRSFVAQKKSARAVKKTAAKAKGKPGKAA